MDVDVAGGASADALASSFDGDPVPMRHFEEGASNLGLHRYGLLGLVDEGHPNSALRTHQPENR